MTTSFHSAEDVAAEIKARVERCTVAQGAETNIGRAGAVFLGRRKIDESLVPCATIIEADDTPARNRVTTQYELAQRYVIFAYEECDPDHPNVAAHKVIRDLKRALFLTDGKADTTWGRKVKDVEYIGRDIGPRADGQKWVVAAVEIVVTYVEDLSQP